MGLAEAMLAAHLNLRPCLLLPQDRDDLLLAKPTTLHRPSPSRVGLYSNLEEFHGLRSPITGASGLKIAASSGECGLNYAINYVSAIDAGSPITLLAGVLVGCHELFVGEGIRSIADLRNASVGVQAATTDYDIAVKMRQKGQLGSLKVYSFDHIQDAMVDLAAGRITAVMKVYPVAAWLARQTPGLVIVAEVPDDPQPLGIGFGKNNPGLLAAVNRALADMKGDGTYARLAQKWGVP